MQRRTFFETLPAATLVAGTQTGFAVQSSGSLDLQQIVLPKPEKEGAKTKKKGKAKKADDESGPVLAETEGDPGEEGGEPADEKDSKDPKKKEVQKSLFDF